MALSDLFGLNTTAGTDDLKQALAAIQGVRGPTAEQLTLPELQKYVQAGILTPQQYQAVIADPNTYRQMIQATQDTSGSDAQKSALQQLGGIVQNGGSTPINEANLHHNIDSTNQAMQAARQGIESNAQQRGVSGGGLEFISKLLNEQGNAETANKGAVDAAANNAQLALSALSQQGQLGGQLQGQSNQMSQAQADAAQQIAEYNAQLQSSANQYNTQNANQAQQMNLANAQDVGNRNTDTSNMRTQYNAQVPQQVFNNDMSKAGAVAGAYGNSANLAQQQAQQQNAFTGNLLGAGAKLGAAGLTGGGSLAATGLPAGADVGSSSYMTNAQKNKPYAAYAKGGEVKPMDPKMATGQMPGIPALPGLTPTEAEKKRMQSTGKCYAMGGEVHEHEICMEAGGDVPGDEAGMEPMQDDPSNDTVDAHLSPGEIVLPRSVAQSPTAPQDAQQFVQQTKSMGGMPPSPTVNSFAEALAKLEENGLELRLSVKGS